MGRWRLGFLLAGVLLLVGGFAAGAQAQRAHGALDQALTVEAQQREAIVADYFNHARDTVLLTAQNPVFAEFYATPGDLHDKIDQQPELMTQVNGALSYLETLYPGQIGEACFIDRSGAEIARVVSGQVAAHHTLSHDESGNPFFGPTFALADGQAFQARPYISPDTQEWVISNSTPIPRLANGRAIVHFEVTVESMRRAVAPSDPRFRVRIVDLAGGNVVVDSAVPQRIGAPLGGSAPSWVPSLLARSQPSGLTRVGDQEIAYQRLTRGTVGSTGRPATNANDWMIVVSTDPPPLAWSGQLDVGPLAVAMAGLICLLLASTSYRQHQQLLASRAGTDDLTGLANRARFHDRLAAALPATPHGPVTLLLLDLDRFKAVNDTLGHPAGDRLLVEVAQRLRDTVDSAHLVARLGGDEFAVLVRHAADADDATDPEQLARRLRDAIRCTVLLDGTAVTINASIGIATAPVHAATPARMLACADVAMYHAKRTGTGFSTYSPDQDTDSAENLSMEAALLAALEYDQILLYYQPILGVDSGEVTGVEALVRWRHPELGVILPAEFLPIAEFTGLIHPLTRHILRLALEQTAQWWTDGLAVRVSVNLSPANCTDPRLPDELAELLAHHSLPASAIKLEITEHAALNDEAHPVITRLHSLGVGLVLDDFGTGYSSLSHLKNLPVDEVKIDQSFVRAILDDPTNSIIVRATATMAHGLGRSVTAEGIEDELTLNLLRALGVDRVQGHYIAQPQPADALTGWLREHRLGRGQRLGRGKAGEFGGAARGEFGGAPRGELASTPSTDLGDAEDAPSTDLGDAEDAPETSGLPQPTSGFPA